MALDAGEVQVEGRSLMIAEKLSVVDKETTVNWLLPPYKDSFYSVGVHPFTEIGKGHGCLFSCWISARSQQPNRKKKIENQLVVNFTLRPMFADLRYKILDGSLKQGFQYPLSRCSGCMARWMKFE